MRMRKLMYAVSTLCALSNPIKSLHFLLEQNSIDVLHTVTSPAVLLLVVGTAAKKGWLN